MDTKFKYADFVWNLCKDMQPRKLKKKEPLNPDCSTLRSVEVDKTWKGRDTSLSKIYFDKNYRSMTKAPKQPIDKYNPVILGIKKIMITSAAMGNLTSDDP
jgi:hypothetical protein